MAITTNGIPGVAPDAAETLSNKTLSAPVISNATFTGQQTGLELAVGQNLVFEGTTADAYEMTLSAGDPTADRTITLPDATGTVALTSNLTSYITASSTDTLTNKTLTSPAVNGGTLDEVAFSAPREVTTISATAAGTTVNFDVKTQGVLYYTSNATSNWTLNVRGNGSTTLDSLMSTGDALTVVFMATQGGTAYYANGFTIDGSAVTPKYQNGVAFSAGNTSSIDVYSYTIFKTASATFTVIASQTKFA